MYIPLQHLIAIENERLSTAARRQLLVAECRASKKTRADGGSKGRLGHRVARVIWHRTAAGAAA